MCRLFGFSLLLQVLAFVICVGFKGRSLAGFSTLQVAQRAVDIIVAAIPVGTLITMAYSTVVDTGLDCLQCNRQHLKACSLPQVNILSFKTATISMIDCRAKCRSRPYIVFVDCRRTNRGYLCTGGLHPEAEVKRH